MSNSKTEPLATSATDCAPPAIGDTDNTTNSLEGSDTPPELKDISGPAEETEAPAPPTILVVHASVGSGHRSAAYAVSEAFEILRDTQDPQVLEVLDNPEDLQIEVLDILDFGRIVFDGDKTASLFTGATRPLYDLTWRYTLTGRLLWGGGSSWSRVMYPKYTELIQQKKPLAVVCTHINAANATVASRMITGLNFPVLCVPTDYEAEGMWPHRTTDLFCVANEAMAETLRPRKVPESDILITGIPTRNNFQKEYSREETRENLGLPQDKMVVLALAGAHLPRPYVHFREALDRILPYIHLHEDLHFVFVAGRDEVYAEHLRQQCKELGITNATVLDYVDEMAALMASSDLVICKSGGLTVTECLCSQVPMILLGKTYGQEKSNRRMLTAMGAALHVTTWRELLEAIEHIASQPQVVQAMLINGQILRRPNAALDIAHSTFDQIEKLNEQGPSAKHRKRMFWFYWGKKPAHTR